MHSLQEYLSEASEHSSFKCNVEWNGGFINFTNSGKRDSVKEFTLAVSSFLEGLKSILDNLEEFEAIKNYNEDNWRSAANDHFNENTLKSIFGVQTKPAFAALAKIIRWANNIPQPLDDNYIDITKEHISTAIIKLEEQINNSKKNKTTIKAAPTLDSSNKPAIKTITLPKPLLLLAGISGTGKSRFVREQAKFWPQDDNFCLVAVRPDWHEPSDLLGYTSRLSGKTSYVATDVLKFLVTAWKALYEVGLQLKGCSENDKRTLLHCDTEQLDQLTPYWLCLDEMNLAPVEQYFADYLSLIETREWTHSSDGKSLYGCDALLSPFVLAELKPDEEADKLAPNAQDKLAEVLGLTAIAPGEADHELWQHFLAHGIAIPPNLVVAGTVNMDETTHGFSRKVIDRAMSFDFGEFFPNDFDDFYAAETKHEALTYPRHSSGKEAVDKTTAEPSIEFLKTVNKVLKGSPFELAFRALNELLLAINCHQPKDAAERQAVWDDFLMQKILPRIEGDFEKLQGDETNNLLTRLKAELTTQLNEIWTDDKQRTDFYRYTEDIPNQPVAKTIECRSRRKIDWMLERLNTHGFTSFWP